MICPFCSNGNSVVIHTTKFQTLVRRVRACHQCGMAWRTFEPETRCPQCGGIGGGSITSSQKFDEVVVRTRKCQECQTSWKTHETVIDEYGAIDFDEHIIDEPRVVRCGKGCKNGI